MQVFKRSTAKLEGLVKEKGGTARAAVRFVVNEVKPRKGTFEVTVAGTALVSLVGMPRPFKKLRELDIDELAASVVAALI